MSRVAAFDDVYAESRGRLLLQLYAYCGDASAADDALNEAFITASRHWHRLSALTSIDPWLRERAIRRIDRRPRVLRDAAPGTSSTPSTPGLITKPNPANTRLLASLKALDQVSRRLMIVRRLDDADLPSAAREVGLTDAAAEQALARATTTLHAAGIDTTPSGLQSQLALLGEDLEGRERPAAKTLRRAGARRRYALTTVLGLALVAAAAGAGAVSASRPFASPTGPIHHHPTPTTGSTTTPTTPVPHLGIGDLLTAQAVASADPTAGWQELGRVTPPTSASVYGDCVLAADNPPPETSWIRDFAPRARTTGEAGPTLRQVLVLAPTAAEAERTFRQVSAGFAACKGHQLISFANLRMVGERARVVTVRFNDVSGPVSQTVVLAKSAMAVTVLSAVSAPGKPADLSPLQLSAMAGSAVNQVCSEVSGPCAFPPYTITNLTPPSSGTPAGFLSMVDLPLVPGITAAWTGTDPTTVVHNPSATPCDRADFSAAGASPVTARTYVMLRASKLPTLFGLTQTVGSFVDPGAAKAFVAQVAQKVKTCHQRQVTLSVKRSTSFTAPFTSGRVWLLRQVASKKQVTTFRVALIRRGSQVTEVTFTPSGGYDVTQAEFVALAKRAGIRLGA